MNAGRVCVVLLIVFGWLSLQSCQNKSSCDIDKSKYIAIQTESSGKWGMMGGDGQILFSDEFKHEPSPVSEGYFSVQEGDYYVLYIVAPTPIIVGDCDNLKSVGVFKDGIIPLTHENERITFVDGEGNQKGILNPIGNKEIVGCSPYSNEGLFVIYDEDNKYGFSDQAGNIVIQPKFEHANLFYDGVALVKGNINGNPAYVVIDKNGKVLFRLKNDIYPEGECFYSGLLKARNSDDTWGFVDKDGSFIKAKGNVVRIDQYNSESFIFMNKDYLWGVMSMNGEVLIRPKYASIKYLPDGNFLAKADDQFFVLNKEGNRITTIDGYDEVIPLNVGILSFAAKGVSTYKFLNKDGKPVGNQEIYGIGNQDIKMPDVVTDFFNYDLALNAFLGGLTANGYGSYDINMPIKSIGISDYEAFLNKIEYGNPDLEKKGWKYNVNVKVITDEAIAHWADDGFESKIVVNPNAIIDNILVTLTTSVPCWKALKDKIVAGLQSKGYASVEKTETSLLFNGKNCNVEIMPTVSEECIIMKIERAKPFDKSGLQIDGNNPTQSLKGNKLSAYNANFFRGNAGYKTTRSGLKYVTVIEGSGASPKVNDVVTVHYTCRLVNGKVIDTSINKSSF